MGDAYVLAGGVPLGSRSHAFRVVMCAFDMIADVSRIQDPSHQHESIRIRVGTNILHNMIRTYTKYIQSLFRVLVFSILVKSSFFFAILQVSIVVHSLVVLLDLKCLATAFSVIYLYII